MKILMINKFFYIKGGSETYYFSLKKLLEDNGHEVMDFSMKNSKNFDSKYSDFFIDEIDYNKKQSLISKIKSGLKIIYSLEAKRKLEKLLKKEKPDIAHLHLFQHQLSASVVNVLKKNNIPIVYTAHDLKMLCPNYKMLDNNIKICEKCKNKKYYNCLKNKCIKKSAIKSAIGMSEAYFNKLNRTYKKIDYIITPSEFYKNKFIEWGVDSNKIIHIDNFLSNEEIKFENYVDKNYYLYFGRLSEEKGILTLINVIERMKVQLKIVGTGPLEEEIKKYVDENKLENIKVLGFKEKKELYTIVANAKCVVLPSEWYENGPYSAIEALKLKRPLLGADIGGIPELIEEGKNGFIFSAKNIDSLKNCIERFEKMTQNEIQLMGNYSKAIFDKKYNSNEHYKKIIGIYEKVLNIK